MESVSKAENVWPRLATTASIAVALTLVGAKLIAWHLSGSVAVLGSLADSFLDIVASVVAFVGVRYAMQPPDDNHRFGHDKAEAVSSLVQLVLISAAALFVAAEAINHLINPRPIRVPNVALGVMVLSVVLTTGLVALQTYAVRRSGSLATESDRAHYVSDLLANSGTIIAILLAGQFGWLRADGIAGLLAAAFLFSAVGSIARRALPQLLDEDLGPSARHSIAEAALGVPRVLGVHDIRTRRAGRRRHIQLHLELPGSMDLSAAHACGDQVEAAVLARFPNAEVLVHLDPFEEVERGADVVATDRVRVVPG